MYDYIEITRPTTDYIKQHAPSLKNILQLTKQGFNVCHPDLAVETSPKLSQVLDLIAIYYGFNSFGALKVYLDSDQADIQPIQDNTLKLLHKISDIYEVYLNNPFIDAAKNTIESYISHTNLPNSINIAVNPDEYGDDSLLAMRYLQIRTWNPVLIKLIKNPQYKLDDADVYTYSEISRMIRVNIINNALRFAQDALKEKKTTFDAPISVFFGGQLTLSQFQNEVAQYFSSAVIGDDLMSVTGSFKNSVQITLHQKLLNNKPHESSQDPIITPMLLDFTILPRLQAMLLDFKPSKTVKPIKIHHDIISQHTETAIQHAVQKQTYEKVFSDTILRNIINNLELLNPYLTKPKAAFYKAEPENNPSNLAWRKYLVGYSAYFVPSAIKLANSMLSGQKAKKSNVYFDKNGLLMFNLNDSIVIYDKFGELLSNYDFSLLVNFFMVNELSNQFRPDEPSNLAFNLMTNYLLKLHEATNH